MFANIFLNLFVSPRFVWFPWKFGQIEEIMSCFMLLWLNKSTKNSHWLFSNCTIRRSFPQFLSNHEFILFSVLSPRNLEDEENITDVGFRYFSPYFMVRLSAQASQVFLVGFFFSVILWRKNWGNSFQKRNVFEHLQTPEWSQTFFSVAFSI